MVKEPLRAKRRLSKLRGRERQPRAKTFSSEESAKTWAAANGIKDFQLENLRNDLSGKKKIRVVIPFG